MTAPSDPSQLAAFVDEELASLKLLLEQAHKPIYPIWAEADAVLVALGYDWSFGTGLAATSGLGIVIPFRSALIALSLSLTIDAAFDSNAFDPEAFDPNAFSLLGSSGAKVEVERDATVEPLYAVEIILGQEAHVEFHTPLEFSAGSVLNFRTFSQTDSNPGSRVCAWMRKEA